MKSKELRKKYPRFVYQNYSSRISKGNLEILFDFKIEPDIYFKPRIIIKNINKKRIKEIGDRELNNLIFHLGLMEIPSYWKATCSPEIIIEAGYLNKEQIKWWRDLIINGMGQYFYENKIDFRKPTFIKIIPKIKNKVPKSKKYKNSAIAEFLYFLQNRYLVPMREGKDSIVTLEHLKKQKKELNAFTVNPTQAAKNVLKIAGIKKPIIVQRKIDPTLLKLNKRGFLNGHTPFTAVLSFLSVFCAVLFDYKNIAFSCEKSANEGNVKYLGKTINHQWAKTSEFEKKFRNYSKKYLAKNINYFSYLRRYTELEIVKMFTKYPKYFPYFLSCNEAYKTDSGRKKPTKRWCGKCPKCLFVYAALYPFLEKKELLKIFGKDLFKNKKLLPVMRSLLGQGRQKPFECVGTKKESLVAFYLSLSKITKNQRSPSPVKQGEVGDETKFQRSRDFCKIPFLLEYFKNKILPKYPNLQKESKKILHSWDNRHYIPKKFVKTLSSKMS